MAAFFQGICGMAFGFLTYVENVNVFLGLSYAIRIFHGMADVVAWGTLLTVLMTMYPDWVSKIMAWTEIFFGLGGMIGILNYFYVK